MLGSQAFAVVLIVVPDLEVVKLGVLWVQHRQVQRLIDVTRLRCTRSISKQARGSKQKDQRAALLSQRQVRPTFEHVSWLSCLSRRDQETADLIFRGLHVVDQQVEA